MRIKEKYCCEFCNTEYDTLAACQHCEDSHVFPSTIDDTDYIAGRKYPRYLNVLMTGGSVARYVFKEELRSGGNV